ncbi:AI-2E family transporter [Nodosilinea sp. LEGE 06152]|uniref:AI-2E family transporter n=1 Tax=Nodosilinea sp. LEGE 06152 TaxID=2777966 RepID=UPI0018805464|nr:AI-2E family transporter [Nodosilinea sp. LEGE 06152]MBE9158053.1 AI-2E family transporter [Nodosilinea sp. LEGE 06152]
MKFSQWLSLVILGVCLYIFWQIRTVLLLALAAVTFVVVLNRAVRLLQKRIADRRVAVLILVVSVLLVLGGFGAIIVPPFFSQLQAIIDLTSQVVNRAQTWVLNLGDTIPGFAIDDLQSLEAILDRLQTLNLEMIFGRFFTWFSNTLTIALNLLLVTVLIIMILMNPKAYRGIFLKLFPSSRRQQVSHVLDNCEEAISGWFIGILFNMTIIATMSMIGLWVLGIPLAFANGLLAGLLAFIPNLGPFLSVLPPAAIALLEAPWKAIAVVILYVVIQQIESNILTPLVMKKQVSLLPAVTLLSQVVFAVLFGFLGLLLALPLTLIIQQWVNEFVVKGFLDQH